MSQFHCTGDVEPLQFILDAHPAFVERFWRSVKHEDIYLKEYTTAPTLTAGLDNYFHLYNYERPHQSLQDRTPAVVYQMGLPTVG